MSSNYFVKIYYSKTENADPEIRRFAIDISPDRSPYQELKQKIAALYPEQDINNFTLQYVDDEGEKVTFSTDEELRTAIEINKGANNLKIYILIRSVTMTTTTFEEDSTINDELPDEIRFDCVNDGNSQTRKSKTRSSTTTCHSNSSTHQGSPHHPWHQHFRTHKSHHRRHGAHAAVPPAHFLQHVQAQIPQWLPNREQTAHITEHIKDHLATLKSNTETYMQNSKEYLENVGQYLQQALSPLGIDCDYHVDGPKTTTKTETNTTTETTVHKNQSDLMETNSSNDQESTASGTNAEQSSSDAGDIEKHVDFCLAKLKSMGFSDSEALSDLVRSKNGDINAVLDAINPRRN